MVRTAPYRDGLTATQQRIEAQFRRVRAKEQRLPFGLPKRLRHHLRRYAREALPVERSTRELQRSEAALSSYEVELDDTLRSLPEIDALKRRRHTHAALAIVISCMVVGYLLSEVWTPAMM